jgi:predicted SAM-dependent methyltransferase
MIKLDSNRSLTNFSKVQALISKLIRNSKFQLRKSQDDKKYLDVGCGKNIHKNFVNMDYSWSPGIDLCWDITVAKYPFNDNRFDGIYTEHCLEHISIEKCKENINEFYRMLKPGGTLRIIVPDGEIYLDIYQKKKLGQKIQMPYEEGYISPMARINGIFRNHGHLFIYDFETIKLLLKQSGFKILQKFHLWWARIKNYYMILKAENLSHYMLSVKNNGLKE